MSEHKAVNWLRSNEQIKMNKQCNKFIFYERDFCFDFIIKRNSEVAAALYKALCN